MHWNTTFFSTPPSFAAPQRSLQARRAAESGVTQRPCLEVLEFVDHWTVQLDVPGVCLEDINVTLTNGILAIDGERKSGVPEGAKVLFDDRTLSKFRRELRVGEGIDQSRIDAELRDGVLKIVLFRSPESSPQKISIRNANS